MTTSHFQGGVGEIEGFPAGRTLKLGALNLLGCGMEHPLDVIVPSPRPNAYISLPLRGVLTDDGWFRG